MTYRVNLSILFLLIIVRVSWNYASYDLNHVFKNERRLADRLEVSLISLRKLIFVGGHL